MAKHGASSASKTDTVFRGNERILSDNWGTMYTQNCNLNCLHWNYDDDDDDDDDDDELSGCCADPDWFCTRQVGSTSAWSRGAWPSALMPWPRPGWSSRRTTFRFCFVRVMQLDFTGSKITALKKWEQKHPRRKKWCGGHGLASRLPSTWRCSMENARRW